jgi:uncharacterized tellurite resistance protein B-like protein
MILKNLKHVLSSLFRSERDYLEDKILLEGVQVEDKLDEAQAYAYIFADIASIDGQFADSERDLITSILLEIFPDRRVDIPYLIKNAENMLASFRSSGSFVERIRQEYSLEERQKLYDAIDRILSADGKNDPMEEFQRERFKKALL